MSPLFRSCARQCHSVKASIRYWFQMFCREQLLTRILTLRTHLALNQYRVKSNMSRSVTWKDVSISVEWGRVAGKTTTIGEAAAAGPGLRVVALHGWLDNANTFDTLAPHLPSGTELLSLDLPGHGLSDHLPAGCHYDLLTYVLNVKKAVDEYGWNKFILLGHSFGAAMCNYFSALFPDNVVALVSLDSIKLRNTNIKGLRESVQNFFKGEKIRKQEPLVYKEEEAADLFLKARNTMGTSIDRDTASILLPRATRHVGNGVVWAHDPRVKATFMAASNDLWDIWGQTIKCPVLMVVASRGLFPLVGKESYEPLLDIYRKNVNVFQEVTVEGTHYVHLNDPQQVAKPLVEFLDRVLVDGKTVDA